MNVIYSITEHHTVQVLTINSLRDEWQNRQILKELQQKINQGNNCFVVNLAQISLISSAGLNFLLSLLAKTQNAGGTMKIANASRRIHQVFEMTKLSEVFTVTDSVEEAVNCFGLQLAA